MPLNIMRVFASEEKLRFRLQASGTESGWAWDVKEIKIFDEKGNQLKVDNVFASGTVASGI